MMVGICRLCAALRKLDVLTTITDTNHVACRKLRECCQIEIRLDDTLPKCICCDCLEALQQAHSFFVKVHESQESLATLFPTVKRPADGKTLNTAKSPTLAESLAKAINTKAESLKETEVVTDCENNGKDFKTEVHVTVEEVVEEEEEEKEEEEEEEIPENNAELQAPIVLDEDEVNLILERVEEEIGDEVYLIEKILGRKCEEEKLNAYDDPVIGEQTSVKSKILNEQKLKKPARKRDGARGKLTISKCSTYEKEPQIESYRLINNEDEDVKQMEDVDEEEEAEEEEFMLEIMAEENQIASDQDQYKEEAKLQALEQKQHDNWNTYPWLCYLCSARESSFIDLQMHCQVAHDQQSWNDIQYKCVDCQEICPSYYSFVNHVRFRHSPHLIFCCDICNIDCTNFKQLAIHRKEAHGDNKDFPTVLLCEECGHGFKDENSRQIHSKLHVRSEKNFECDVCGKRFARLYAWQAHQKVHSEENEDREENQISSDHEQYKDEDQLQAPEQKQHENWNTYPWLCYLCSAEESSFIDLQMHCQVAHDQQSWNDSQYKCADCQKICPRYYSFVNHVRFRHRPHLTFCCDICNIHWTNFKQLAIHRKKAHADNKDFPTMLLCEECGHGFKDQNSRQMHSKIHVRSEKNFECDVCGKRFARLVAWKQHQKVHSDIKEFSCEQCGKSFRQKANLDMHIMTHIGDKPYECSTCQKTFKTPFSLEKHLRTHFAPKTFKCDYCDNMFRTKDSKLSHERTHTRERPYKCTFCERSYSYRSTFIAHQHSHTGKRPYSCEPCNHHFTNWSNYNKHMKRRHANQSNATDETKKRRRIAKDNKKSDSNSYFLYEVLDEVADSSDSALHHEEVAYSASTEDVNDENNLEIITGDAVSNSESEKINE